jgi:hypothetical protein
MPPSSLLASLVLAPPKGWTEVAHPDDLRELRAGPSGERGILQVSRFVPAQHAFVAGQRDLGAFAAELGKRLGGAAGTWGTAKEGREATCALGRLGLAVFEEGSFAAMLLFVTVTKDASFLWTYLGPDLEAPEIEQTLTLVTTATLGS